MALVVTGTCFLALMYVAFLPFIGKRARKKNQSNLIIQAGKRAQLRTIVRTVYQMTQFKRC